MAEQFANSASTTLNGSISVGDTILAVASTATFPPAVAGQFRILIDSEIMLVTGKTPTTFTVVRGQEGTTAATHPSGASVGHILTAGALTQLKIDALVAHATSHQNGGSDEVATATAAANAIPKANSSGYIDSAWMPPSAQVMGQICVGCAEIMGGSTVYILPNFDFGAASGTDVPIFICTRAGGLRDLYVASSVSPGAGEDAVFTVRVNGVDTALTATISGTSTSANDTTHVVSVSAGDVVSFKAVTSAGAASLANVVAACNFVNTL